MNRYVKLTALFAMIVFMQTACATNAHMASGARTASGDKFSDVRDRDWKLTEVRAGKDKIIFERAMLAQEGPNEIFTLRFDAERVSGVGCPNRYFAPYALTEKKALDIKPIAGTLMAALFEPEQLKEREFFAYLENADKWNIVKGNLELRSTNDDGAEVVLVFSSAD
ncbi:MAG: META domain-containing protein [Treponema sp.]|jgi:heat shock protein HslJ|nr:META domain-containing protein [Treponema sp.]